MSFEVKEAKGLCGLGICIRRIYKQPVKWMNWRAKIIQLDIQFPRAALQLAHRAVLMPQCGRELGPQTESSEISPSIGSVWDPGSENSGWSYTCTLPTPPKKPWIYIQLPFLYKLEVIVFHSPESILSIWSRDGVTYVNSLRSLFTFVNIRDPEQLGLSCDPRVHVRWRPRRTLKEDQTTLLLAPARTRLGHPSDAGMRNRGTSLFIRIGKPVLLATAYGGQLGQDGKTTPFSSVLPHADPQPWWQQVNICTAPLDLNGKDSSLLWFH